MWQSTAVPLLLVGILGIAGRGDATVGLAPRDARVAVVGSPALTGVLRDEAGQPLTYWAVQACTATACFPDESGADGRFHFNLPLKTPIQVVLKTPESLMATPRRAAAMWPVRVATELLLDVGSVHVPNLPEGKELPAIGSARQLLPAGDGLELTLRRADLKSAIGGVLMDLAARRIPMARVPAYPLPANERVLAVYALHPFGATSESPIGVRMPSTLPAGTPVKFRTMSEFDGSFSAPVPGRATGQHVVTDPSVGITELTYLVITR